MPRYPFRTRSMSSCAARAASASTSFSFSLRSLASSFVSPSRMPNLWRSALSRAASSRRNACLRLCQSSFFFANCSCMSALAFRNAMSAVRDASFPVNSRRCSGKSQLGSVSNSLRKRSRSTSLAFSFASAAVRFFSAASADCSRSLCLPRMASSSSCVSSSRARSSSMLASSAPASVASASSTSSLRRRSSSALRRRVSSLLDSAFARSARFVSFSASLRCMRTSSAFSTLASTV
mmetsp:Transcript_3724/g.8298  ORF Transcript_3724/g.8298 Transcript_3724/m.8298 type:complete len:236 (-) Transcript_3724:276-983(-)